MTRAAKAWVLIALAAIVAAGAWWFFRVDFYLWRLRQGDARSSYALGQIGPQALPRIQREIHALGKKNEGGYRSELVGAVAAIRYDVVADRTGRLLFTDVQAALVDADPRVVNTLRTALVSEPEPRERAKMTSALARLDFNTRVDLFCGAFGELELGRRAELLELLGQSVADATEKIHRPRADDPWRGMSEAQLEQVRIRMRQKLACVPPRLENLIRDSLPSWVEGCPSWGRDAIDRLAAFGPLPDGLFARLANTFSAAGPKCFNLTELLISELARSARKSPQEAAETLYRLLGPRSPGRQSVMVWVRSPDSKIDKEQFFCHAFTPERASGDPYDPLLLFAMVTKSSNPCIVSTLMQVYERTVLRSPDDARGETLRPTDPEFGFIRGELSSSKAWDPRVATWAKALRPRVAEADRTYLDPFLSERP